MKKLRLNYLFPGKNPIDSGVVNLESRGIPEWIHGMVESNPDVIFFFTTETTDIWE